MTDLQQSLNIFYSFVMSDLNSFVDLILERERKEYLYTSRSSKKKAVNLERRETAVKPGDA